jgi:plastocyanin
MFTFESRVFFGQAALALVAGVVYFGASGDEMGTMLFVSVLLASLVIGALLLGRPATAEEAGQAREAAAVLPQPSAWPMATAVAVTLLLAGIAVDVPLVVMGLGALALATAGWFTQVWREHAGRGDVVALDAHRRIIWPTGVPVLAFAGIAIAVISFSRILLAISKDAAVALALVAALVILIGCAFVALRPRVHAPLTASAAAVLAAGVVVGGVIAAAQGERDFHAAPSHRAAEMARGIVFTEKELEVGAGGQTVIDFQNHDEGVIHNIAVYTDKDAEELVFFGDAVSGPDEVTYRFSTPQPGEYFYRCEFHFQTMTGALVVEEPSENHES